MHIKKINSVDSMIADSIVMLLGITVLSQFYSLLMQRFFLPDGLNAKILDAANYLDFSTSLKTFLLNLLPHISALAPILGLLMLITAICLILLIARGFLAIFVGCCYLVAWIVLWHYPGMWTFEFLFPALFGICVGLFLINKSILSHSIFKQLAWPKWLAICVIILITLLLWHATSIAFNKPDLARKAAIYSAWTFFFVSVIHLILDKYIPHLPIYEKGIRAKIVALPWIDMMIIIIGAMMVMQVYANYFSGLYAIDNYRALINYYAKASGAHWLQPFLVWSAQHATALMPLQFLFESVVAIFLTILIFQGPALILSAGLFGILAFAELGVSANWPPNPDNLTWEWELLLVTGVSLFIGIGRLVEAIQSRNFNYFLWGKKIFKHTSLLEGFSIAVIAGLCLYAIGIATQIFGSSYKIISACAALTFAILILISFFIDRFRCDKIYFS